MKLTFLGTGTSTGIPAIGCDCEVCLSPDPRNQRRRASVYVEVGDAQVLIDTPPDFREQALIYKVRHIDAVLFTHSHADHMFGFDDIRRFNSIQDAVIPAHASTSVVADLRRVFDYIGVDPVPGVYRPRIEYREFNSAPFAVGVLDVQPLPVEHGPKDTHGFLLHSDGRTLGYFPDCHRMSDAVVESLSGIDVMILDGLRHRPHTTHMTIAESVAVLTRIQAKQSYITHVGHDLDHGPTEADLPDGVLLAHDGLVLDW